MHTVAPCLLGVMDQDPCWRLASLRQTEAAVADLPTRRTHPRTIPEGIHNTLPVTVQQARGAELPTHSATVLVVAYGFSVDGLLPALMASGAFVAVVDLVRATCRHLDVSSGTVRGYVVQLNGSLLNLRAYPPATEKVKRI